MNNLNWSIDTWLTIATIVLSAISIIIAICSSRKTSKNASQQIEAISESTNQEIKALKNVITHQENIAWAIIQHYYMLNQFELAEDKNQLTIIQQELMIETDRSIVMNLKKQELSLSYRIKNREKSNQNYDKLIKILRSATDEILF